MDLVILAGGKGSRIQHLNKNKPKPMVKIQNKAFLEILINHYAKFTFENIFILAGYKGQLIKKKFDGKYQNFTKIECIIETVQIGLGKQNGEVKYVFNSDVNRIIFQFYRLEFRSGMYKV